MIIRELLTRWGIDVETDKLEDFQKKISFSKKNIKALGELSSRVGKGLTLAITLPILAVGAGFLKAASDIESIETAFVGILGGAEAAKDMVAKLNEFTAKTPFQLEQVSSAAKGLLAARVGPESIADRLQVLGDIAAAAKIPLTDMSQIFSKIKNKGKAMTEEILQMSDRGIPVIAVLAEQFGVAESAIFDMASEGKISFDAIQTAMETMTAKGGFANKAMILQSNTLGGLMSTMRDNVMLAAGSFGKIFLPMVKKVVKGLIEASKWVKSLSKGTKIIILVIGALLAVVGPLLAAFGFLVPVVFSVITAFTGLAGILGITNIALALLIIKVVAVVAVVALLAVAIILIFEDIYASLTGKESLFNLFEELFPEAAKKVQDVFFAVFDAIFGTIDWIEARFAAFVDFILDIPNKIKEAFAGVNEFLKTTFSGFGGELLKKIIPGAELITAGVGAVAGASPETSPLPSGQTTTNNNVSMNPNISIEVPPGTPPELVGGAVTKGVDDAISKMLRQASRTTRPQEAY